MYRDIKINTNGDFFSQCSAPLVADDVGVYRICMPLGKYEDAVYIKVTAIRADGSNVMDGNYITGQTAYYILRKNMYALQGELKLRVSLLDSNNNALTTKIVICDVLEGCEGGLEGEDKYPILYEALTKATQAIALLEKHINASTLDHLSESVTTAKLADGAVTTTKIGDIAITTEKIADRAVNSDKLAADSVTNSKIANGAVSTVTLMDGAVQTAKIKDGAVTAGKIASNTITEEKLASSVRTLIREKSKIYYISDMPLESSYNSSIDICDAFMAEKHGHIRVSEDDFEFYTDETTVNGYARAYLDFSEVIQNGITKIKVEMDTYMIPDTRMIVSLANLSKRPGTSLRANYDTTGNAFYFGVKNATAYSINANYQAFEWSNLWLRITTEIDFSSKSISYKIENIGTDGSAEPVEVVSGTAAFVDTSISTVTGIELYSYVNSTSMFARNVKISAIGGETNAFYIPYDNYDIYVYRNGKFESLVTDAASVLCADGISVQEKFDALKSNVRKLSEYVTAGNMFCDFPFEIGESFEIYNDLNEDIDFLYYGGDATWVLSKTLKTDTLYELTILSTPVNGADWENGSIEVREIDVDALYEKVNSLEETVSEIKDSQSVTTTPFSPVKLLSWYAQTGFDNSKVQTGIVINNYNEIEGEESTTQLTKLNLYNNDGISWCYTLNKPMECGKMYYFKILTAAEQIDVGYYSNGTAAIVEISGTSYSELIESLLSAVSEL